MAPLPHYSANPLERAFFVIARWFGIVVALLSLVAVLIAAAVGLYKLTSSSDQRVRPPSVTYDQYRRSLEASRASTQPETDRTLEQKQAEATRTAAEAEFEKRLKPHLDIILANLTSYATKTDQGKPGVQAVGDFVRDAFRNFSDSTSDSTAWAYIDALEKATADLAADGERLSKLDSGDKRRVRWDIFLDWFSRNYANELRKDFQRIERERREAELKAAEAPQYFYAAASSFGIFLLGTILLVLLKIELNGRVLRADCIKEAPPPTHETSVAG